MAIGRSSWRVAVLAIVSLAIVIGLYLWRQPLEQAHESGAKRVLIASIVEIEPISKLRNGFKSRITDSELAGHVAYTERNAQGDPRLMAQIADEVARQKPDLVYVLGTPLAQAIQKRAPDVVLVQGAVTDPVEAGLAASWEGSGRKYAANSDRPPTREIVKLIRALTPDVKRLAYLYNPSEANSVAVLKALKSEAARYGLVIKEVSVTRSSDIPAAVNVALVSSDALFIPPDNTITAALRAIIQAANTARKPVFATTEDAITEGALAGITTDFETLGYEAGDIALSILLGNADPAKLPIALPKKTMALINPDAARRFQVTPPQTLQFKFSIK